jgi:hypothetical protein
VAPSSSSASAELLPATRRALARRVAVGQAEGRTPSLADRGIELSPAGANGRGSRFRAEPDGSWTGLDGYYTGETLRLVPGAGRAPSHFDLGTFVFTREPYEPGAPLAARPDPDGWRSGLE